MSPGCGGLVVPGAVGLQAVVGAAQRGEVRRTRRCAGVERDHAVEVAGDAPGTARATSLGNDRDPTHPSSPSPGCRRWPLAGREARSTRSGGQACLWPRPRGDGRGVGRGHRRRGRGMSGGGPGVDRSGSGGVASEAVAVGAGPVVRAGCGGLVVPRAVGLEAVVGAAQGGEVRRTRRFAGVERDYVVEVAGDAPGTARAASLGNDRDPTHPSSPSPGCRRWPLAGREARSTRSGGQACLWPRHRGDWRGVGRGHRRRGRGMSGGGSASIARVPVGSRRKR
ncbi:hypothetical protein F4692_004087 [Nocardioides cavernae]|uniref:Uncharacterized protein n=1 Tax=Nocardioides cavernae TaxID=1921566 RepID=A0A7Y9H6Q2_9ACTN|nr:hypothetical protein [Nocardioides cavernae]